MGRCHSRTRFNANEQYINYQPLSVFCLRVRVSMNRAESDSDGTLECWTSGRPDMWLCWRLTYQQSLQRQPTIRIHCQRQLTRYTNLDRLCGFNYSQSDKGRQLQTSHWEFEPILNLGSVLLRTRISVKSKIEDYNNSILPKSDSIALQTLDFVERSIDPHRIWPKSKWPPIGRVNQYDVILTLPLEPAFYSSDAGRREIDEYDQDLVISGEEPPEPGATDKPTPFRNGVIAELEEVNATKDRDFVATGFVSAFVEGDDEDEGEDEEKEPEMPFVRLGSLFRYYLDAENE
ncbi:hypothetical protein IMY05_C4545000400 [Salix suchowensis]|nr:hypothetical protein IMY05_C4545000400 [Salix suchowensis]